MKMPVRILLILLCAALIIALPFTVSAPNMLNDIKMELMNQEAWLQGLYVYDAVAVAVANVLGGKGTKKQKYLEQPIELNPPKQTPEQAKQKVISQLDAWKEAWDIKHRSKHGDK